jgi:hypothetical protein
MAQATIKTYQSGGAATHPDRVLIRTLRVETASDKRLTSKRAGQLLTREFPDFESARRGMIKTDEGLDGHTDAPPYRTPVLSATFGKVLWSRKTLTLSTSRLFLV